MAFRRRPRDHKSGQEYAAQQADLGLHYLDSYTGDREGNLAQAIAHLNEALRFFTAETAPRKYAMTHHYLGVAYAQLSAGDRTANLTQAIAHFNEALRFFSAKDAPREYAITQHDLGVVYAAFPAGDRMANLARAIDSYTQALRFMTPETAPAEYTAIQHDLGAAYAAYPAGDRAANLAKAISCYTEALRFNTVEAAPLDYAITQHELGNAYRELPTGDRATNVARAIDSYTEALRFMTAEAAPAAYAAIQHDLGVAYAQLPTGDQAANLARANASYMESLRVRGSDVSSEPPSRPRTAREAGSPVPERRFLQGRFPERVRLGEEVTLLVRLGLQPGARLEAGLAPLAVPEAGLEVVLLLVDSPGFTLRSPERQVVRVVPRQDSSWAAFELQAAGEGVHTLQVEAFAGGTGLGGLAVQVSADPTAQTGPLVERSSPAAVTQADPGEVTLLLTYHPDQQVYRYRLEDSSGYYAEDADSDRLLQPPGEAIERLVDQLNTLARGQAGWDAATTNAWLRGQGITLWDSFIPQALQREFWQRRDRITRMTIVSKGDPVPWELLYPFDPGRQDAGFLIDQFPVVPRRYGARPPCKLELRPADLVLSGEGSLTAAQAEIAALDALLRGRGLAARHIGDLPGLLQAFQQGDLGLLHFSCRNAFARGAPNASRILLGNQPFEPVFLAEHAGRFASPLVFLNACRTDGQAPLYTTVEGWAASFLRAGAGAFIGSLWEVTDTSAATYAQQFYNAAFSGHTLGQAARQARDAIRDNPGDPTWLAYTLYGDPAATVSTQPLNTD